MFKMSFAESENLQNNFAKKTNNFFYRVRKYQKTLQYQKIYKTKFRVRKFKTETKIDKIKWFAESVSNQIVNCPIMEGYSSIVTVSAKVIPFKQFATLPLL